MRMLREQGLDEKAVISSYTARRVKVEKVCCRVDHTDSAVLRKPDSGTGRPATVSACAVCRCKTVIPIGRPYQALKQCQ